VVATELVPEGYSWFSMPESARPKQTGVYRNVPIPGRFYDEDFKEVVTMQGRSMLAHEGDDVCFWRWTTFIRPLLLSTEGFAFLIDVAWVDQEYAKGPTRVSQEAKNLCKRFFEMKYLSQGHTRSLADIDSEYNVTPLTRGMQIKAGAYYLITSLWQPPRFPEEKAHRASESEAHRAAKGKAPRSRNRNPWDGLEVEVSWEERWHHLSDIPRMKWFDKVAPSASLSKKPPPQYRERQPVAVDEEMTEGVETDSCEAWEIEMAEQAVEKAEVIASGEKKEEMEDTELPLLPKLSFDPEDTKLARFVREMQGHGRGTC